MRKSELSIPKRELHWKKYSYLRNKQENVFYLCECGKKYVSFPALYLHFERKHQQKISNLHDPTQYNAIMTSSETTYLFFVKKRGPNSELIKSSLRKRNPIYEAMISKALTVVEEFKEEEGAKVEKIAGVEFMLSMLEKFSQYLYEYLRCRETQIRSSQEIVEQMPNYFNDFLLSSHAKVKGEQTMMNAMMIFLGFSQWLNGKKYSQLVIVLNNSQAQVKKLQN